MLWKATQIGTQCLTINQWCALLPGIYRSPKFYSRAGVSTLRGGRLLGVAGNHNPSVGLDLELESKKYGTTDVRDIPPLQVDIGFSLRLSVVEYYVLIIVFIQLWPSELLSMKPSLQSLPEVLAASGEFSDFNAEVFDAETLEIVSTLARQMAMPKPHPRVSLSKLFVLDRQRGDLVTVIRVREHVLCFLRSMKHTLKSRQFWSSGKTLSQ